MHAIDRAVDKLEAPGRRLTQNGPARSGGASECVSLMIARLEAGDHEPSLTTLARLSRALGIEFHIDITPQP